MLDTRKSTLKPLLICFDTHRGLSQSACELTVKMAPPDQVVTWCHLYSEFTYIYFLLIEKDLHECRNVSVKFTCVLFCAFCLETTSLIFFGKFPLFIPIFLF